MEDTMDTVRPIQLSEVRITNLLKEIYTPITPVKNEFEDLLPKYEDISAGKPFFEA
jgi:hypothetical protein